MDYVNLFSPIAVGKVQLKNRIVIPAHGPRLNASRFLRYMEERVKHDVALWVSSDPSYVGSSAFTVAPPSPVPASYLGGTDVAMPNPATSEGAAFLDAHAMPRMKEQADLAHRYGAFAFGQIGHGGSYATSMNYLPGIGPSDVPDEMIGETPHALDEHEIADLIRVYAEAAARIRRSGMHGMEVHACHGLLVNAFLSPISNRRSDQYGGSLENRARLLLEILRAVRETVGKDFPVGVRMPGQELVQHGLAIPDMVQVARWAEPLLDYINITSSSEGGRKGGVTIPAVAPSDFPQAAHAAPAAAIKQAVALPILLTGRITDPSHAEWLIASGAADMVGMVRAFMADPLWASKARTGDRDDIRLCTGANEGCRKRTLWRHPGGGAAIGCTQNAAAGREEEMEIVPAASPKHVLVAGGGPGGMEAARVLTLRGHRVTLFEKSDSLGGQVRIAVRDPRTADLGNSIAYLTRQMEKLGVDVRLSTELTPALAATLVPDAVIVATGATPLIPAVPGIDGRNVVTGWQVLQGEVIPGARVCLVAGYDGHHGPASLAELLADRGCHVTLITERMLVAENQDPGFHHVLLKRLLEKRVAMHTLTGLVAVEGRTVRVRHALTREQWAIEDVDTVVLACGGSASGALATALKGSVPQLYAIGDCLAPRRVLHAVLEGARAARAI